VGSREPGFSVSEVVVVTGKEVLATMPQSLGRNGISLVEALICRDMGGRNRVSGILDMTQKLHF
jgi:hypothetical protein